MEPTYSLNNLKSELRILNEKYGATLEALNLKLEYSIKSTLSGHDQIMQIFSTEFNLPVEITVKILSYLSIDYLCKTLGANFDQLCVYVRNTGYEEVKSQLMKIGGYEIADDGSFKLIYKKDVILVNLGWH